MHGSQFDNLIRSLTGSRRRLLGGGVALVAGQLGVFGAGAKKKRKKRKLKKAKPNAFGCLDVGKACKNESQCCSNLCQGKKGKKHCQAHDQSTCQAGQTLETCDGEANVSCTTSGGGPGLCLSTTGNAGYCFASGDCFACTKDADCEPACGPGAACIVCAEPCFARGGTFCAGAVPDSCDFGP
jgi:hypothetical protein